MKPRQMRDRPPNRRQSVTVKFYFGGMSYFGTVSFHGPPLNPDLARPRELFLSTSKATSAASYQASASAIYASFALQHGASLDDLLSAAPMLEDGTPADPVGFFLWMIKAGQVVQALP